MSIAYWMNRFHSKERVPSVSITVAMAPRASHVSWRRTVLPGGYPRLISGDPPPSLTSTRFYALALRMYITRGSPSLPKLGRPNEQDVPSTTSRALLRR